MTGLTRRNFIGGTLAAATLGGARAFAAEGDGGRNRRPYAGVDWTKAQQIRTTSHGHCVNQKMLDTFLARGFEFLTISNYYPSAPTLPGKTFRSYHYHVHHDWPVMVNGRRTEGPFDWNRIIGPWKDELTGSFRAEYPFREGGPLFPNWPDGLLEAPNAEHHNFTDPLTRKRVGGLHICAPGSNFRSGTCDAHGRYRTDRRGYCSGSGEPWDVAIGRMLDALVYPEGGGVTINHPRWSRLDFDLLPRLLDFDPRVLGIEVYNFSGGKKCDYVWSDCWSEDYWDFVLRTGRQCFGFSVPDWDPKRGVNVLLPKERTVRSCLEAYRLGNFYGAVFGDVAKFTRLAFDGRTFEATTDVPCGFALISAEGIVASAYKAKSFSWTLPDGEEKKHVYLRLKAYPTANIDEVLFTQPQMLT